MGKLSTGWLDSELMPRDEANNHFETFLLRYCHYLPIHVYFNGRQEKYPAISGLIQAPWLLKKKEIA